MSPSILFKADAVPRYGDGDERGLAGNVISQRAFLTAMITDHCVRDDSALELRFASSGAGEIHTFLGLHPNSRSPAGAVRETTKLVARLLPIDYGWRLTKDLRTYNAAYKDDVHVARVVRTAQILNLPYAPPDPKGETSAALTGFIPHPSPGGPLNSFNAARHFPSLMEGPAQFLEKRICLPFLGGLDEWRPDVRVLFEQVLANSPAIVSIMLRPLQEREIQDARLLAAGWKRMLDPFLSQLANSGFADAGSLARTFDRFAMPAPYLAQASIKCAARSAEEAIGVASIFAACLGGPTAFKVERPSRAVPVRDLKLLDGDYPVPGPEGIEQAFMQEQAEALQRDGVEPPEDPMALDFMARFNHIYTLDEAHGLARLPTSDDDGLPGMPTRMIPPFSTPWTREAPASDTIRIGVIQPRHADPLAGAQGHTSPPVFHTVPLEALTKHALIVGSTGSGKTLTTLFLTRELWRNKVPFLVIEPVKTEYYEKLAFFMGSDIVRWRFEGTPDGEEVDDFLSFDPMTLQDGVTVARHASYLKSCFLAAFPLEPVEAMLLEGGLRDYYIESAENLGCGLKLFTRGSKETTVVRDDYALNAAGQRIRLTNDSRSGDEIVYKREQVIHPSLAGFIKYFNAKYLPRKVMGPSLPGAKAADSGRLAEVLLTWRQLFLRRFEAVQSGPIGLAAARASRMFAATGRINSFDDILAHNTVIELDGIPDEEQKSLMMAFLLTALFERRQADDLVEREKPLDQRRPGGGRPRHMMIVEEAHRVLSASAAGRPGQAAGADARSKSVSLFVDMLAEIRAFGQGIAIVEQIPTKIVSEAIKNTNLKIMLRLTSRDDREYLGEAMNFTDSQKRFVTTLRAERGKGVNMVVFEEGVEQPLMLSLPFEPTGSTWVFDQLFEKNT